VPQIITPDDVEFSSACLINATTVIDEEAEKNCQRVAKMDENSCVREECEDNLKPYEGPPTESVEIVCADNMDEIVSSKLSSTHETPPKVILGPSNMMALSGESIHLRVKVQTFQNAPDQSPCNATWSKFVNVRLRIIIPLEG